PATIEDFPELKLKILHTAWVVAENVPEELQNYQSICEIGSMIDVVEEVDLIVAMIPPVVETVNLDKRASVEIHGINDPVCANLGLVQF
ncbi:hypothetical protein ACJX0J_037883, partial [Zea mays]